MSSPFFPFAGEKWMMESGDTFHSAHPMVAAMQIKQSSFDDASLPVDDQEVDFWNKPLSLPIDWSNGPRLSAFPKLLVAGAAADEEVNKENIFNVNKTVSTSDKHGLGSCTEDPGSLWDESFNETLADDWDWELFEIEVNAQKNNKRQKCTDPLHRQELSPKDHALVCLNLKPSQHQQQCSCTTAEMALGHCTTHCNMYQVVEDVEMK